MKKKLFVTLPNGEKATRTTSHDYKFVIIGCHRKGSWHNRTYGATWAAFAWSASKENAEKVANQLRQWSARDLIESPTDIQIIPVEGALA